MVRHVHQFDLCGRRLAARPPPPHWVHECGGHQKAVGSALFPGGGGVAHGGEDATSYNFDHTITPTFDEAWYGTTPGKCVFVVLAAPHDVALRALRLLRLRLLPRLASAVRAAAAAPPPQTPPPAPPPAPGAARSWPLRRPPLRRPRRRRLLGYALLALDPGRLVPRRHRRRLVSPARGGGRSVPGAPERDVRVHPAGLAQSPGRPRQGFVVPPPRRPLLRLLAPAATRWCAPRPHPGRAPLVRLSMRRCAPRSPCCCSCPSAPRRSPLPSSASQLCCTSGSGQPTATCASG